MSSLQHQVYVNEISFEIVTGDRNPSHSSLSLATSVGTESSSVQGTPFFVGYMTVCWMSHCKQEVGYDDCSILGVGLTHVTDWGQIDVIDNPISVAVGGGHDPHQEKRHRKTCWQTTTKSYSSPLLSAIWLLCMYMYIHTYY